MAEGCPHVTQVQLPSDKSFLNPRTWACSECGFTDSVWACLVCGHVACGRTNSRHALKHFELTKHPLAIEVNQRYIHCYLCDDYVLNDNRSGDLALVQSLLSQVASQHYQESYTRSGRVMKPAHSIYRRSESKVEAAIDHAADKRYTALCHWRYQLLSQAFNTWRSVVVEMKHRQSLSSSLANSSSSGAVLVPPVPLATTRVAVKRKRPLTPGMTGLRNLGNTCYMNAVLQSLGHLVFFREFFRQLLPEAPPPSNAPSNAPSSTPTNSRIPYIRQTTVECFKHITKRPVARQRIIRQHAEGGLVGGAGGRGHNKSPSQHPASDAAADNEQLPCLSAEMHALMRVMWSGKWALVTPHAVLNAVWRLIPVFHGYTQHDAQEFLCELLDHLQGELDDWPSNIRLVSPSRQLAIPHEVLPSLFQGKLTSKVSYSGCGHESTISEPFWDLSLEFPQQYQECSGKRGQPEKSCSLYELLDKFTCEEALEGEIYRCERCSQQFTYQAAKKRLLIAHCPDVLRLHLKRFRWCGRSRHKISTHAHFPQLIDLTKYCAPPRVGVVSISHDINGEADLSDNADSKLYDLSSVIIHHGIGFQSGHYTAYCWNSEACSWIHCNDNRLSRCPWEEVQSSQAYILFYTRRQGCCNTEDTSPTENSDLCQPPSKRTRPM